MQQYEKNFSFSTLEVLNNKHVLLQGGFQLNVVKPKPMQ